MTDPNLTRRTQCVDCGRFVNSADEWPLCAPCDDHRSELAALRQQARADIEDDENTR